MARKVTVPKADLWRAIRAQCLACCGGECSAVRRCNRTECSLHPYRFGRVEQKEPRCREIS